jgi:chemotaxis protein methyltransferase CheR
MSAESDLVHAAALLLDARIGLKPDLSFRPRLARALRDVADARNIDHRSLVGALASDVALLDQVLDRVTVQETGFFRHPEQFDTLVRLVLPAIDGPLRAWSAACANGQEAYSLAMLVNETGGSGSVLASDVSPAALHRTAAGYYHDREMRGVSAERRREHFHVADGGWQANQSLLDLVTVQRHNLLDQIPAQVAECQVVMCRNVLIYFTKAHAELFLDRLADLMDPTAYLFIGGAETLWQVSERFEPIQVGTSFAYRPRVSRPAARPEPAVAAVAAVATRHKPIQYLSAVSAELQVTARAAVHRSVENGTGPEADRTERPTDDTDVDQEELGRQLLASGSVPEAIVAFRRWAYQSPKNPAAHFQLGLALDIADERPTARRAYRAALTALDRCDSDRLADVLQGYDRAELRRLLVDRARP